MRTIIPTLGLLALALPFAPVASAQDAAWQDVLEAVPGAIRSGIRGLDVDASRLTAGGVVASLSPRNVDSAYYFVRDLVEFDIYAGSTRGARGTLFARAGNSLDRSLLLGALLDELNVDWRIAQGTLPDDAASRLVALATRGGSYTGSLLPEQVAGFDASLDIRHRNIVTDHYWVEMERDGEWIALDTSDPALEPGATLVVPSAQYAATALPDDAVQEVSIRLYYETSGTNGGQVLELVGPTSELAFRNLSITIARQPDGSFVPGLESGETVVTGDAIYTGGLERVWIECFFRNGGLDQRIVRDLYQSDSAFNLFEVDQAVFSVLLLPGFVGPDYYRAVVRTIWDDVSDRIATLVDAVDADAGVVPPGEGASLELHRQYTDLLADHLGVTGLTFAHASDELALRLGLMLGVRPFYDRPRVVMSGALIDGDAVVFQLDLRSNTVDTLPYDDVPWAATWAFQAIRGRVDSALEGAILEAMTGTSVLDTAEYMDAGTEAGVATRTIHLGNVARLSGSSYSAEAQRRLSTEITNLGFVAVAPTRPLEFGGVPFLNWWRIEPSTGAMLGISEIGLHPAFGVLTGAADAQETSADPNVLAGRIASVVREGVATSIRVATSGYDANSYVCDARCELLDMTFELCGGGRPPFDALLDQCLASSTVLSTAALVGQGATCASQVANFVCGVELFDAVSSRLITLQQTQGYTGPWTSLDPLAANSCVCP